MMDKRLFQRPFLLSLLSLIMCFGANANVPFIELEVEGDVQTYNVDMTAGDDGIAVYLETIPNIAEGIVWLSPKSPAGLQDRYLGIMQLLANYFEQSIGGVDPQIPFLN